MPVVVTPPPSATTLRTRIGSLTEDWFTLLDGASLAPEEDVTARSVSSADFAPARTACARGEVTSRPRIDITVVWVLRDERSEVVMKKILVGLDGSPRQAGVLAAATELARKLQAKLVLFRAVTLPNELPPEAYLMPPNEVTRVLEKRARVALDEAGASVPSELIETRQAVVGSPWQGICRAAKEHDVDLIVIGAHGYDVIDRVLGTTAAKVVNHAERSVIVVRGERLSSP
jgi:nucleotide-binding universal stress UspA family protein